MTPKYSVDRFLLSLGAVLRQINPDECIMVFDSSGGSKRRRTLYAEYKQNRNMQSKYSMTHLTDIQEILKIFPIKLMAFGNTEADDIISELAKQISKNNQVLISSSDQDFLQLVDQNIKIWQPIKKIVLDTEYIIKDFGMHPRNFIIYKILVGDKSDNIPGVPGIGLKTLIKYYGDVLKNQYPIDGNLHLFIQHVKSNISPIQQKILFYSKDLMTFYKIMNLSEGCISPQTGLKVLQSYDALVSFKQSDKGLIYKLLMQKTSIHKKTNLSIWVNNIINILQR